MLSPKLALLIVTMLSALSGTAFAVAFNGSYSENFDEIGTTGTTLPGGFTYFVGESGTSNATWSATTGIVANGTTGSVASMVANTVGLTATTTPSGTNNNGFNAAASSAAAADRVISTSPTGVSGAAFELTLTNSTGASLSTLSLGYTIQRYTSVTTANELPGYEVFVSLDGATWTNIAAFNTSLDGSNNTIAVPNTAGSTVVPSTAFTLPSAWTAGSNLNVRWVDDNAVQTSPDQIIGLNNVSANVVPEPSIWVGLVLGFGALAVIRHSRARSHV